MDLTSRLEGYLNHEIAYPNPIPILPVPKTLHDKKDTTLLQMALKAFVKERLYGRFNNYERQNQQNTNHLLKNQFSTAQNSHCISSITSNKQKAKETLKRQNNQSMLSEMSHAYLTEHKKTQFIRKSHQTQKQKSIPSQQKRLSQISSSFDFKAKGFNENKSLANSHSKLKSKNLTHLHQSFNLKNQPASNSPVFQQEHPGTSFISAIDYYQKPPIGSDNSNQTFKLPQIHDRRKNMTSKLELGKNQRSFTKKQTLPQVSVNDQLWLLLSKDKQQKPRKIRQNKSTQLKDSIVSISKSPDKIDQNKNVSILKNNDAALFSKQAFQSFLNNAKLSIPFFMLSIMSFFQMTNKITDKSKRTHFQLCFSNLFNQSDRAWSVAVFRFFDVNTDGKIDSSDLFKTHNFLEEIIEKVQSFKPDSGQANSFNESAKNKIQKRQTTQTSQNESYAKNEKLKAQTKEKVTKQKTDESQKMSEQSYQVFSNFMNKNLENLKSFQKYVQKLNHRFLQKEKSLNRNNDFYNPQIEAQNQSKSSPQIRYLQQALLKNKDLKISDLSLILQQMTYQNSKTKKKVIEIDYSKMNIKLSSSYVQTFIATNHNQETRMNRQHLQSLKDSLKCQDNSKGQISSGYEKKQLPCIKYAEFYEERLFLPLKNMFFQCLHSDIADTK